MPNKDIYKDDEKNEEIKKTIGISPANKINLSLGITNFPSPRRAMSQKKRDRVDPMERRKPLLASRVTGTYGMKKNNDIKIEPSNDQNDN